MKRFFKLCLSFSLPLLVFLIISLLRPFLSVDQKVNSSMFGLRVFIDPGHGGYDPGTNREMVLEKDINLRISKKLYEIFIEENVGAIISRNDDYDLSSLYSKNHKMDDLKKRVEKINESGANLLVSIHLNALSDTNVKGPMVYYRHGDEVSKLLATSIQTNLNDVAKQDKITHGENYYLFKKTSIPAVLVECGFISNDEERKKLVTDVYQFKIAHAIFDGIENYWLKI